MVIETKDTRNIAKRTCLKTDKNENIRVSVCMMLALAGSSNVVEYLEEEE